MDSNKCSPSQLLSSDYKDLGSPLQVKEQFERYLLSSSQCLSSLISILDLEIGKTGKHDFSLSIDMHDLIQYNPVLGNLLLRYPATLLPLLEESIVSAQCRILDCLHLDLVRDNSRSNSAATVAANMAIMEAFKNRLDKATVKGRNGTRVHARLVHLPPHGSNHKSSLSSLGASDVGKILQLSGTVTRASTVQMYESSRAYKCRVKAKRSSSNSSSGGCGACFVVSADLQCRNNALVHPVKCPTEGCMGKDFEIISQGHSSRSDYQEIKVQESFSSAANRQNKKHNHRLGNIPRALLVKLQHDLVDQCQPGDDVVVVGTLMSHWDQHPGGTVMTMGEVNIGMVMHAHSIRVVSGSGAGSSGSTCGGDGRANEENNGSMNTAWDDGGMLDMNAGKETTTAASATDVDANSTTTTGASMMMRDEMVQEFQKFWKMERHRKRPIAARNFICQAVCPALYGMSLIKLALLLTLVGGSQDVRSAGDDNGGAMKGDGTVETGHVLLEDRGQEHVGMNDPTPVRFTLDDDDDDKAPAEIPFALSESKRGGHGSFERIESNAKNQSVAATTSTSTSRRREQSHLLLVGDPGCGKSQFLRFAAALCPRSVFTNGSGTSSAGLTCAAVQEKSTGQWVLEAGALVLADRGVCAIDEFSCIKPTDRTTIHEAMEQQTLSIAKAGIVCKLNCRTTVIAVTNAKGGYYDPEKPFDVNVGIEPPLLSRFDLIFKLIDGSDAKKDDNVATFLLNRAIQGSGYDCARSSNNAGSKQSLWNMDKLRAYIATVKSYFHPTISDGASRLLERHYSECRSSEYMEFQVTVRLLESLIRLSQAHARLMHRNVVEVDDAVAVILLMECSVASTSSSNFNVLFKDPATTVFPEEDGAADIEFVLDKKKVLEKYDMLEYLTKDDLDVIKNHDADQHRSSHFDGWDALKANQSMYSPSEHCSLPNHGSGPNRYTLVTSQDHYGRFTQSTSASPPFNDTDWNSNSEWHYNNTIVVGDTSHRQVSESRLRKRKPNYSVD